MSLEKQLADYGRLHEELFGAIELDEITNPLTVGRQELTPSSQTLFPQRITWHTRYAGPAWAVAAFVSVLAVGAVYLLFSNLGDQVADNPPPTTVAPDVETMTDLQIIEAGVAALYSGDAERAVELFGIGGGDDEAQIRFDDLIRQEAAFQAIVDGRLTLDCTEEGPGMFTCNVPYHNALTDVMDYEDSPGDPFDVVVQNGVITQFARWKRHVQGITHEFPWHNYAMVPFLREEVEGSEGCWDHSNRDNWMVIRTPECARLIMDHLDEWAAWYRTNS